MSVVNIVAHFVCDECNKEFSVSLDVAKVYEIANPLSMAVFELKQPDEGEHFCDRCWDEVCENNVF